MDKNNSFCLLQIPPINISDSQLSGWEMLQNETASTILIKKLCWDDLEVLYFAVIPDNEAGNYKGDQGHLDGGKEKKAEVSASKRSQKGHKDKSWKSHNRTQWE